MNVPITCEKRCHNLVKCRTHSPDQSYIGPAIADGLKTAIYYVV